MLSIGITQRLRAFAVVLALAALLVPTALARHDASGTYGPLDQWAYTLVTDHSAGQAGGDYGPLDPWAYNLTRRSVPLVSEHSASQNGAREAVAAPVPTFAANGFDWGDAGIGAGTALGTLLLALGAASLAARRLRGRAAVL